MGRMGPAKLAERAARQAALKAWGFDDRDLGWIRVGEVYHVGLTGWHSAVDEAVDRCATGRTLTEAFRAMRKMKREERA